MNLARLDLNLIVALRALLEERNVTRAGERVGLSQPAMSASLARLRRHFGDDLLARVGGHYELTALGQVLLHRTSTAYEVVERLFASQADFDPGSEKREFKLVASDYAVAVFGADLARVVHEEAPGIRLRFVQTPPTVVDDTATLLSTTDGLLMPHGVISDFPATDLYEDSWVFLVADDHPSVEDRLTLKDLGRPPVGHLPADLRRPCRATARHARHRATRGGVRRQLPTAAAAGGGHAAHRPDPGTARPPPRTARRREDRGAPYEAVPLREAMWWHPVHTHDAAHIWLRETTARVGRRMTDVSEAPTADSDR